MNRHLLVFFIAFLVISCNGDQKSATSTQVLTEFSDYYTYLASENMYSHQVTDTFKIFKATPKSYNNDSTQTYPLIIILDANAFFESTVTELKFNSFIGVIPESIVVGVGYKDFLTMDSLRSRDYTYPTALPEYEMPVSGQADKMKKFIDDELLPKLATDFKIDKEKITICGHSLGAYFTLFYALKSIEENSYPIKNIVAASPSLHYNNRFLFEMEKGIKQPGNNVPLKIYVSMGSEDMNDETSKGILDSFEAQVSAKKYDGLKIMKAEYSNFGHIDAAIPGFVKGITYVLGEN